MYQEEENTFSEALLKESFIQTWLVIKYYWSAKMIKCELTQATLFAKPLSVLIIASFKTLSIADSQ